MKSADVIDMFLSLRRHTSQELPNCFAVTIGASGKKTLANWHLDHPQNVIDALGGILNHQTDPLSDVPAKI